MRFLPLLLLLSLSRISYAQSDHFILALQPGISVSQTGSTHLSAMAGIQMKEGDQFLVGFIYKQLLENVGHNNSYLGGRIHVQSSVTERLAPYLSADFLHGSYYIYGVGVAVKKRTHINGTVGLAYKLNQHLSLHGGYAVREYNPRLYFKHQHSPYKDGAFRLKLSLNMPLS